MYRFTAHKFVRYAVDGPDGSQSILEIIQGLFVLDGKTRHNFDRLTGFQQINGSHSDSIDLPWMEDEWAKLMPGWTGNQLTFLCQSDPDTFWGALQSNRIISRYGLFFSDHGGMIIGQYRLHQSAGARCPMEVEFNPADPAHLAFLQTLQGQELVALCNNLASLFLD